MGFIDLIQFGIMKNITDSIRRKKHKKKSIKKAEEKIASEKNLINK